MAQQRRPPHRVFSLAGHALDECVGRPLLADCVEKLKSPRDSRRLFGLSQTATAVARPASCR